METFANLRFASSLRFPLRGYRRGTLCFAKGTTRGDTSGVPKGCLRHNLRCAKGVTFGAQIVDLHVLYNNK